MSAKQRKPSSRRGAAGGLRAVILAGGKGVRLLPYTANFPKPLVPLGDTPVLEVLMRRLTRFGIKDITLALGHLSELIEVYFQRRQRFVQGLKLRFISEEAPTGTAGSLAAVRGLKDTFLVMNGDLLTDLNFHELAAFHRRQDAALTIAVHKRDVKIDLGVLEFDDKHRIFAYHEKPQKTYHVSMGIYVYEPRVLKFIKRGEYLDFPDLVLRLIAAGEKVCAYPSDCLWLDIGRPDDYARAQKLFEAERDRFDRV